MLGGPTLEVAQDDPIVYGTPVFELITGHHTIFADNHRVFAPEGCRCAFDRRVERPMDLVESLSAQGGIRNLRSGRLAHDRALPRESSWDFIKFRRTGHRRELTGESDGAPESEASPEATFFGYIPRASTQLDTEERRV
jgi:hypothetical protein